ncbi:hypothetical protein Tco_1024836 [Tanacetum coccineum]
MVVRDQAEMGEGSANPTNPHHTPTFIQPSTSQPQKKQKPRKPKRKDTQIPQSSGSTEHVANKAVYRDLDDSLVRATTTASSLEVEQDSGGGSRRQETMGDTIAQTSLQQRVLDLETTKTTQAEEIASLKRRVKKLEQKKRSRTHGLKRLYKVGLTTRVESSRDKENDADMFDVNTLTGDEVLVEPEVAIKDVNLTVNKVTLAQALAVLKSVKPKVKANVVEEPSVLVSATSTKVCAATTTTTATIPTPRKGIDKGKGIMVEEPEKMKKKDQISFDKQEAKRLQVEFDENERLAKIDADYQLAQRLQAEEQEQFTTKQKATLFNELLEQRRKNFIAKRAKEKRNKPPTQAQQIKIMYTYLKNMEGKKPKDLKNKSFNSILKMFDKAFKRVYTCVDFRTYLVKGSSKRAGTELE